MKQVHRSFFPSHLQLFVNAYELEYFVYFYFLLQRQPLHITRSGAGNSARIEPGRGVRLHDGTLTSPRNWCCQKSPCFVWYK